MQSSHVITPAEILGDYEAHVEKMFDRDMPTIISNKDTAHAAVLVSTLFRRAKKTVDVFCRNLQSKFYDSPAILREVVSAADRGVKIRIVSQSKPEADCLLKELRDVQRCKNVEVRICAKSHWLAGAPVNFIVMDDKAFRLETDRENHVAWACANDPTTAGLIRTQFERLINLCEEKVL